ncbi:hypothetical protein [Cohnella yongneupensis]|uniref:Uncharacterized protein n=1 Tax=Cohnella yongneupensis TaxID=425006 RepID=A0ABW0R9B4_9BACL
MPYVMKHAPSGTILSFAQRNGYSLAYYGIRLWEDLPDQTQMAEALAEAGIAPGDAGGELGEWEPLSLTEHEAKMANVKLRNDPKRVVAYRDGAFIAK